MESTAVTSFAERIAALGSGAGAEHELARAATELAAEILGLHGAALLVTGKAERPAVLHNHRVDESYLQFVVQQYMNLPGARIISSGHPSVIADVRNEPKYAPFLEHYERAGIRSLVLFPQREPAATHGIVAGEIARSELLGVLGVYHPEPIELDPTALALAHCLAEHVASLLWSHRLRRDRDLYMQQAVLERSNDAVAVMTAGVVHDFNNVLGAMLGMASLWPLVNDAARDELQNQVKIQVEQASQLTRSLLDIARPRHSVPQERRCELVMQTQRAIRMASATAHPQTRLELTHERPEHWAQIDCTTFTRIVLNLLLNAIQAIGSQPAARVTVRLREVDDTSVLEVDDDGPGVVAGFEERIFEPYVSVGKASGTGVGLAAARGLAERAGGSLCLRHRSGPGACFVLTLPQAPPLVAASAAPKPIVEEKPIAPTPAGKVLVAEDEALQRQMFGQALREAGYEVVECSSGIEALQELTAGGFTCVVLDHRMPGATGLAVLRRLRSSDAETPVVLASGFEVEQQDLRGPEFRRTKVVQKPISGVDLVEAVRRVQ